MRKILIILFFVLPGIWLIVQFQLTLAQSLRLIALCLIFAGMFSLENAQGRLPPTRYVIADDPGKATRNEKYLAAYERKTGDVIMELAAKGESRGFGRELGGKIYVRFDCEEKYNHWDYDQRQSLLWLLRNGERVHIFVSGVSNMETR